ncbi:glycosyl hydrolase family 8 [Phragmitibacter flavus]|nr:glycosyl hydrolase family 8 [Phragmitibacter flavus]
MHPQTPLPASSLRRALSCVLLLFLLSLPLPLKSQTTAPTIPFTMQIQWDVFKRHFIDSGRVIDTVNQNITHSEGQGYGMLLATYFQDPAAFESIWNWTQKNLQVRESDRLFAWSWGIPSSETETKAEPKVLDPNNASDGDILIAWALYRASRMWGNPAWTEAAHAIIKDLRQHMIVVGFDGRLILLPGQVGFVEKNSVITNPSYWVFPALQEFASQPVDSEVWQRLINDGIKWLNDWQFGKFNLPPDWVEIGKPITLPERYEPVFGYNAIRIPLYLQWAGLQNQTPALNQALRASWTQFTEANLPSKIHLKTHEGHDPALPGIRAIYELSLNTGRERDPDQWIVDPADGYYSAALLLLVRIVHQQSLVP